ncbi:hypothetical protein [Mucilaginibacter agri]|uniref:Uncharacterized protein n=1 Tax=Mucilaginibacter agri TaxID=2695265 RepID=A0A965ZDS6_9SPHI|nr:hypothetical protein [Mucilaginibacter agri]NCD68247.1 hypothetical protein [Mucilaginibacter agri]
MSPIETLSRREFTITYTDACPSELIHNTSHPYLSITLVNFLNVEREKLLKILQFKKARGLDRRMKVQDYIIDCIEKGTVIPLGVSSWNERTSVLQSGKVILNKYGLVPFTDDFSNSVTLADEQISYGHAVSLAWYSLALAVFAKRIGPMMSHEQKKKAAILIDLLPGDNINFKKNLKIVNYIIDNSELAEFFMDTIRDYQIDGIGLAYGIKDGSTKAIKEDYEFTVTDWIAQSFNSLTLYEKFSLGKNSDEFKLAKLAQFLLYNKYFNLIDGIEIID